MLEITLTCPACDTQNNVPVEDGASEFVCVVCGEVSPITKSFGVSSRFAQDPNIGKVISGFEIVEKVGEGGFGSVYRAIDSTLQREVALKLLKRELTDKPEFVHKFLREAITAAKLNHPHIVAIHKFGQEYVDGEDVHYLIMEFLEGQTLADLIEKKGALPIDEGISITLQAADALANAHERDVIHRDIKPENLMIDARGNVKITDFGLAKIVSTTMQTTKVVGTPHYMSPEQFEGKAIDGRTDIYSLGVTFYYMLTRAKPYEGENTVQIIYAILTNEPRPPMEVNPGVSEDLWAIIKKMIAKEPETRYQGFWEVQRDLETYRDRSLRATVLCPKCEAENPQGRFCRECGAPLVVVCPSCSSEEPAGTRHCGQCGSNIALALSVKEAASRASQARSQGELRQALKLYEEILDLEPGNAEAEQATAELRTEVEKLDDLRERAETMVSRGDFDEALGCLEDALQDLPAAELKSLRTEIRTKVTGKAVAAHRLLAEEALTNHDHAMAVDALRKAVELDADDPELQLELREAEKRLDDLEASLAEAREMFDAQQYSRAFSAAKKALDLSPTNPVAKDLHERSRGFIESADALLDQGREHLAAGRYEEARSAFENAVDVRPDETAAARLAEEADERLAAFETRLAEARSLVDVGEHARALAIVEDLSAERSFDERVVEVRAACHEAEEREKRTQRLNDLVATGREAEAEGRHEEAVESYEQAVALDPENTKAANLLEKVRERVRDVENLVRLADEYEQEGNLAQAIAARKRLLEARPGDMATITRITELEERKRGLDKAVEQAEAALEARRLDDAERFAGEALAVSPSHQRAEKIRAESGRLRAKAEMCIVEARNRIAGEMFAEAAANLDEAEACGYHGPEIAELRAKTEKGRVGVLKSNATRSFRFEDFEGAVKAYEEVLKVDQKDPEALAGRKAAMRRQRALRRESPLLKFAAAVLLLLGLGGVQLLAVSRPLEASEGADGDLVAVRPPVTEAVEVKTEPRVAWEGSGLDDADFQRLVRDGDWSRLEELALVEAKKFPGDPAVDETLAWVRAMSEITALEAANERIPRLQGLVPPAAGPLVEFAPAERDAMLRRDRASLLDRGELQTLATEGDLGILADSLREAVKHGAADETQGLTETIEFVDRLRAAEAAAATQGPVEAIRMVYRVELPDVGPFRSTGSRILDARANEAIEGALEAAWNLEQSDRRGASDLYAKIADVLEDVNAPTAFAARATAAKDYLYWMTRGEEGLERAGGQDAAAILEAFGVADESFQGALANAGQDPDRRAARESAAHAQIEAIVTRLESHTAKRWPKSDDEWKSRPEQELAEVADLFALYRRIIRRERELGREESLDEADRRLTELAREQGD